MRVGSEVESGGFTELQLAVPSVGPWRGGAADPLLAAVGQGFVPELRRHQRPRELDPLVALAQHEWPPQTRAWELRLELWRERPWELPRRWGCAAKGLVSTTVMMMRNGG